MAAVQLPPLIGLPIHAPAPIGVGAGPAVAGAAPAHTPTPLEQKLIAWVRAGLVRLAFYTEPIINNIVANRCSMQFKLVVTHSADNERDPNFLEPNWREFEEMKNLLRASPYNFRINWATKVWYARLPVVVPPQSMWTRLRNAAADWDANFGPGGAAARQAFADRERQAENAQRAAAAAAYQAQFGIDPDQARRDAEAAAAARLHEQERELMERLSRPPVESIARHVPLKYGAMTKVRDHIMGTVHSMVERIVHAYAARGLDPTEGAANGTIVTIDAPLEIIEGLTVGLRATTTISAARNVPTSRANDPEAAITWRVLFPQRTEARRVVNRALAEDAHYAGHVGGGQVQVRSANTLNVALNALWESLDAVRQEGLANAPPRAPVAAAALAPPVLDERDEDEDEEGEEEAEEEGESEGEEESEASEDGSDEESDDDESESEGSDSDFSVQSEGDAMSTGSEEEEEEDEYD